MGKGRRKDEGWQREPARQSIDYRRAAADPRQFYESPEEVLGDPRLDRLAKIQILDRWMLSASPEQAGRIRRALAILGAGPSM